MLIAGLQGQASSTSELLGRDLAQVPPFARYVRLIKKTKQRPGGEGWGGD